MDVWPVESSANQGGPVTCTERQNLQGAEAHMRSLYRATDSEYFRSAIFRKTRRALMRKTFRQFLLDKVVQVF
jgi:hypothetical protein